MPNQDTIFDSMPLAPEILAKKESIQSEFSAVSLKEWLDNNNITHSSSIIEKITVECGYEVNELQNLYQLLSIDGRLLIFLLLKISNLDADVLKTLIEAQAVIEKTSPPVVHFIWVGPPTADLSELFGVRSLRKAITDQPIYFWVLDNYKNHYLNVLEKLNIQLVEIISIEGYAKKTPIFFSDKKETLLQRIEYFKSLIEAKIKSRSVVTDFFDSKEEKELRKTDIIRDRVTIVDYIKSLICVFKGGYISDVDMTFISKTNAVLPKSNYSIFPMVMDNYPDVWFFYMNPILSAEGRYEAHAIGYELPVQAYDRMASEAYVERGDKKISYLFVADLGTAICNIVNLINNVHYIKTINQDCNCLAESPFQLFQTNRVDRFQLNDECTLLKYYGGSHIPKYSQMQLQMHYDFLLIRDKNEFNTIISQRSELTSFNILKTFDAILLKDNQSKVSYVLENIMIFHLALLVRPDFFSVILDQLCFEKLSAMICHPFKIDRRIYSRNIGMERSTLISLIIALSNQEMEQEFKSLFLFSLKNIQKAIELSSAFASMKPEEKALHKEKKGIGRLYDEFVANSATTDNPGPRI